MYLRISREDDGRDESLSIVNQEKLLRAVARRLGLNNVKLYIDDGVTGTKTDRKEFTRMMQDVEKGLVSTVIVKNLSRLSRVPEQANSLVEKEFPEHNVRFIAVTDCIDSDEGEDEFLGFRTLMNGWYSRDISKKRKATNVTKGTSGEPLSNPLYGYMKNLDPKNPVYWILDPEAAPIVRRIFDMTLDDKGTEQIAAALSADKILTPFYY